MNSKLASTAPRMNVPSTDRGTLPRRPSQATQKYEDTELAGVILHFAKSYRTAEINT